MDADFKGVPAVVKCFRILELFADSQKDLGISEISNALGFHKSTVFNMVHTLVGLGILENRQNKFNFGLKLYTLGKTNGRRSELIQVIHPYLEEINKKTGLSSFLGMRSGMRAVIIDKVDAGLDIKISSEVGMRLPLLAGGGGRALLSLMPDQEIDSLLKENELKKFTRNSCVDKKRYKELINKTRKEGITIDKEEYIEGIKAFAIPLKIRDNLQAAIWAVGLRGRITDSSIQTYSKLLLTIKGEIEARFAH